MNSTWNKFKDKKKHRLLNVAFSATIMQWAQFDLMQAYSATYESVHQGYYS